MAKWSDEAKARFSELRKTWVAGRRPFTEEQRKEMGLVDGNWKQRNPAAHAEHAKAYRKRNREKIAAQNAVAYALRTGVKPDGSAFARGSKCEVCGAHVVTEAHHDNYGPDHWFDVVWVCHPCHVRTGKRRGQVKKQEFKIRNGPRLK